MCAPIAAISAGVSAAGALVGGVQSMMQGRSEADAARRNAQLEIDAARDSQDRGRLENRDFYRQVGQVKGDQAAAMAANGLDVGYGSAARVQTDTANLVREDVTNLYSNIHERTQGSIVNAQNFVQAAKAAKWQGQQAMISSVFQAGSSIASAFEQQKLLNAKLGKGGKKPGYGTGGAQMPTRKQVSNARTSGI